MMINFTLTLFILIAACIPTAALSAEQGVEQATQDAIEQAATQAAKDIVEKATADVAEKAAEKAVEKAVEKVAADAAAEDELKAKRPDHWMGSTKVHFFVFVVDIDKIDDANQNFAANVWITLRWKDKRLANPGGRYAKSGWRRCGTRIYSWLIVKAWSRNLCPMLFRSIRTVRSTINNATPVSCLSP